MHLEDLEKHLAQNPELSAHKDYLLGIARPSVAIHITQQGPQKMESYFGGKPMLPADFKWPIHPIGEYRFLGQINFSDIADTPISPLPSKGILALFYALDEEGEIFWGDDGYMLGYYWPDGTELQRAKPPYDDVPRAKRIVFTVGLDLPRHEELRDDWPFDVEHLDGLADALPSDYLLGYPSFDSLAYDPSPGKDWTTLLTIRSHDAFDWCWHDGDKLMVFIETEKLVALNFSHLKADAG